MIKLLIVSLLVAILVRTALSDDIDCGGPILKLRTERCLEQIRGPWPQGSAFMEITIRQNLERFESATPRQ